ncbi:CaiB/BaiF CoA transferase family protein [Paraburkholderia graminis]|uniref:CaiB/BaiF CoA transferase family protein n=1 Tax=Paraburkholderia graminis TaxID=60548 RepID=UPI0038BC0602
MSGIRVLDLTSVVMGPSACSLLADYGADVVKVESPSGDVMRHSGPMRNPGMGHFFMSLGRNKRSIVLDLKQKEGRAILLRLMKTVDVLVYNLRPQSMARLGLDYESLCALNPALIYAGAYGFSQKGPYAARPAYDDLIQGMCGIPWLSLKAGADIPRYAPMVLVDRIVGLQLFGAVTTALLYRARTGKGQRVDVPMYENMLSVVLAEHLSGTQFEPALDPPGYKRSLATDRRPYKTKDGYLCALVYNDRHWRSFFSAIGKPEMFEGDERFQSQNGRLTNIEYVYRYLSDVFSTRTTDEWLRLLEEADIPAARMYSIDDILTDEHLNKTGFIQTVKHPSEGELRITAIPTEWSESQPENRSHAPRLGEHTAEVLLEIGCSQAEVDALVASGVARVPEQVRGIPK